MNRAPPPRLSLVIPTRERVESLAYTIATALDQASHDYEVLVSDNASQDKTQAVVTGIGDLRLRYVNTGRRVSMCDNFEFALEHATGSHVIFIGDDDAVMPGAVDRLLALVRSEAKSTIYTWPTHIYDWPAEGRPARLAYLAPAMPATVINLKRKARFVVRVGGWKYYALPSCYHSAVPRRIFEAIRAQTGRVFHSTQPDVFTAMAIPALADQALNVGCVLTLNGRSAKSNGLGFVSRSAQPNLLRFLGEYGDYQFHRGLFPDVSAMAKTIPDAVLVAMDLFQSLYGDLRFNYEAMWAYMCRLGFCGRQEVLQKRSQIHQHQAFNLGLFLLFLAVQDLSALRRKILNRRMDLGPFKQYTPGNIRDFVKTLAMQESSV